MPFLLLGAATLVVGIAIATYFRRQEPGLPYARATLHMLAYAAPGLAAVMAVYFVGDAAGLSDLWIAILEVGLALTPGRARLHRARAASSARCCATAT